MAASAARSTGPTEPLLDAGLETEGACELLDDISGTKVRRARPGNDQHIERRRQLAAMAAEEFAHQATDAVARRRATDFAAGGDAQA